MAQVAGNMNHSGWDVTRIELAGSNIFSGICRAFERIQLRHRRRDTRVAALATARHYRFASGAARTCRQAAGNCAMVIGGFGFGGTFGGFGCSTESLNQ